MLTSIRFLSTAACLAVVFALARTMGSAQNPQSSPITLTLTGQSMIRSDIRATAPAAVPVIQKLLKGDVVFTNFEAAVAEEGETVHEGRGFLTPRAETRDAHRMGKLRKQSLKASATPANVPPYLLQPHTHLCGRLPPHPSFPPARGLGDKPKRVDGIELPTELKRCDAPDDPA